MRPEPLESVAVHDVAQRMAERRSGAAVREDSWTARPVRAMQWTSLGLASDVLAMEQLRSRVFCELNSIYSLEARRAVPCFVVPLHGPQETIAALVGASKIDEARRSASPRSRWSALLAPPVITVGRKVDAKDAQRTFDANKNWIRTHSEDPIYSGRWIALRAGDIVDSDSDRRQLQKRLRSRDDLEGLLVVRLDRQG